MDNKINREKFKKFKTENILDDTDLNIDINEPNIDHRFHCDYVKESVKESDEYNSDEYNSDEYNIDEYNSDEYDSDSSEYDSDSDEYDSESDE